MSRRIVAVCLVLAIAGLGWLIRGRLGLSGGSSGGRGERPDAVSITKQPVVFAQRSFDPASPPSDMPPLAPGEEAECDSKFMADARVVGRAKEIDATDANITVTQVEMTLQLNITIWTPVSATQHVAEHEDGHRQISEHYYQ